MSLSADARARLVEVMARAIDSMSFDANYHCALRKTHGDTSEPLIEAIQTQAKQRAVAAIAAAERAGFKWEEGKP